MVYEIRYSCSSLVVNLLEAKSFMCFLCINVHIIITNVIKIKDEI